MIPELLRKQTRAMELEVASLAGTLDPSDQRELDDLRVYFELLNRRAIRANFAQCRRLDAHQKRTRRLNVGSYAHALPQAA